MEEEIRKIVRDELSKYFCNIMNNEEYDFEQYNDEDYQDEINRLENELNKRAEECKLLRIENKKLRERNFVLETENFRKNITKKSDLFDSEKSQQEGGFNF